nr:HGxxPAAW family protein [Streptomyces sp. NRRL F-5135]
MAGSSHGHTPAAWTGVIISFVGFCVAGVFMVAANTLGFWAGMAIAVAGGVVGLAMKAAGLGMPKESEAVVRARAEATRAQVERSARGGAPKAEAPAAEAAASQAV